MKKLFVKLKSTLSLDFVALVARRFSFGIAVCFLLGYSLPSCRSELGPEILVANAALYLGLYVLLKILWLEDKCNSRP